MHILVQLLLFILILLNSFFVTTTCKSAFGDLFGTMFFLATFPGNIFCLVTVRSREGQDGKLILYKSKLSTPAFQHHDEERDFSVCINAIPDAD